MTEAGEMAGARAIVVTGGLGALGGAVTRKLVARGHRVAVIDYAAAPAEVGAAAVVIGGVDLADEAQATAAYSEIATRLGSLAGVVNAAGGFHWEMLDGGSIATWDGMYRLNLRTAAVSCRAAIPTSLTGAPRSSTSGRLPPHASKRAWAPMPPPRPGSWR